MPAASATRNKPISALAHRKFFLLWAGQAVSLIGNGIYAVALPIEVFKLTSSPAALALVAVSRTIPFVFLSLSGGSVVDRANSRIVMLASDSLCAGAVAVTAVLVYNQYAKVWELCALSAVFGIASAFFRPASTVIVPELVPRETLVSASALTSLNQSVTQYLLGPLFGGILVAVIGTGWAFGLDAISFLISALFLAAMGAVRTTAKKQAGKHLSAIAEGLRYCRSQAWLWWSMIGTGISNLICFVPLLILEPLLVRDVFNGGPVALGAVLGANGVGGIVASTYASRQAAPRRPVQTIWTAWIIAGVAVVGLGVAPWLWCAVLAAAVAWGTITYGNLQWFPLMQKNIPPELLGRVSSVDWMMSLALAPVGTLASGYIVTAIGARPTMIAAGAVAALCGLVLVIPGVRAPDRANAAAVPDEAVMS